MPAGILFDMEGKIRMTQQNDSPGEVSARPFGSFADPALEEIALGLEAGGRLTREDGIRLFRTNDLLGLGWLANRQRERLHGAKTYYNINRHINYSNICVNHCRFCAFARKKGAEGAWEYSLDEIYEKAERDLPPGGTELHIVGGLHPDLPFEFYLEMLRGLKARLPHVHLKAFTAVEIAHMARLSGLSVREVLEKLIEAGMGSLPGGGAEVLMPNSRQLVCGEKISGQEWLAVHRTAHQLGLKTTCTLLYGHVEPVEDRVDHMLKLRELQDETGGFQAFIPLAFHPQHSRLPDLPAPSGVTDLKVIAVGRLLLDNIPNIKAYWVMLGIKIAQLAQHFGANDLDGTVIEETIYHMAGAETPQSLSIRDIRRLISETGRTAVQRDTLYHELGD